MIIDTSNALCGPGFLPGPRLSEGRFLIDRGLRVPRLELRRGRPLRPPKCRPPRVSRPVRPPRALPPPSPSGGEGGASSARGPEVLLSAAAGGSEPPPLPARWGPPTLAAGGRRRGGRVPGDRAARRAPGRRTLTLQASLPPPRGSGRHYPIRLRPQIRRDDPLNLSILLSGGKETNKDSLSSGERRGKSPAPNPRPGPRGAGNVAYRGPLSRCGRGGPKSF